MLLKKYSDADYMDKKPNSKDFIIKELQQEKLICENIIKYLAENDVINKEIFDSFSHQLRTPVVTIKAYTDMILEGHFGKLTPLQQDKLERVKESTDILLEAIFQMLEKSRKRK